MEPAFDLKKKKETVVVTGNSSNVPVMGLENVQTVEAAAVNTANAQANSGEPEGMVVKSPLGRNFLCSSFRGCGSVCGSRGSGKKRPDTCYSGSDEADERDRERI